VSWRDPPVRPTLTKTTKPQPIILGEAANPRPLTAAQMPSGEHPSATKFVYSRSPGSYVIGPVEDAAPLTTRFPCFHIDEAPRKVVQDKHRRCGSYLSLR
jgi:hypothetical protein